EIRDTESEMARAFDLSYRTLTDAQRTAFRRLGLHPGSDFTADAAAALLGLPPDETERLLEALLACHLLREPVPDRYRYHDLLREYAYALALSEDPLPLRAAAVRRLIDFTLQAADRADRLAYPRRIRLGPPGDRQPVPRWADSDAAKAWFTAERGNLLAIERAARTGDHPEAAAQLAYLISGFLDAECHWQDAESVLGHAVAHWSDTHEMAHLSRSLIQLSAAQAHKSDYARAAANGEQALEIARGTGDQEAEAEALRTLGTLSWHLGENRAALAHFQGSFTIKAASGDAWDRARGHNNVAISLLFLGEHDRALEHFRSALAGFQEAADRTASAKTLNNIGDMYLRKRNLELARKSFEESLPILEATGNRYDRATVRRNLADILTETGRPEEALPLYLETHREFQALGDRKSQSDTLIGIGDVHRRTGESERAVAHLLDALGIARAIGATHQEIQALHCLGQVDFGEGRLDAALRNVTAAVAVADRTHNLDEGLKARETLDRIRAAVGSERADDSGPAR
ncbi:tetratricopeptide repeat protein, partial [Streptomyces sp. NPDC055078]